MKGLIQAVGELIQLQRKLINLFKRLASEENQIADLQDGIVGVIEEIESKPLKPKKKKRRA